MSKQNLAQGPAKVITNKDIKNINQKYQTKIIKGEIQVTPNENNKKLSPSQLYDKATKQKKLVQAKNQKEELLKKIEYINRSIETIKNYDFNSARTNSVQEVTKSKSPVNPVQIIKRQKQMLDKYKQENKKIKIEKQQIKRRKQQKVMMQARLKEEQLQAQKVKKKQQIYENMQKIKKRMQNRQQETKKQHDDYKKILEKQTLFKKLEQEYSKKQNGILQQRKKKLANIRNLHKPVHLSQIKQHEKTFFQALKEKQSMRQRQRRINNFQQEYRVSYKSPLHKSLARSRHEGQMENQSKIKVNKMKQFAEHVRQNFVPAIDENKRQELQKKIEEQVQRRQRYEQRLQQQNEKSEQIRRKGLRYLQQVKQIPKKRSQTSRLQPPSDKIQYKNYLTHSQNSNTTNWKVILESKQSKKDKAFRLHYQAQKFQNNLRLKEQKARLLKNSNSDEIDQQYFEMIKAKLQLLKD